MREPSDLELEAEIYGGDFALRELRRHGLYACVDGANRSTLMIGPAAKLDPRLRHLVRENRAGLFCALAIEGMKTLRVRP